MENIRFDRRALTEVYDILMMLEKDDFNKIPSEIVDGIKENRDKDYEVDFDNLEEKMLPDTEKILAALYANYIATQEEKNVIFQMIELEKKKKYKDNNIFKNKQEMTVQTNENTSMVVVKDNIFVRIKNWIKKIFGR